MEIDLKSTPNVSVRSIAYSEAMKHARALARLKTRKGMAPHVHAWAQAMKTMLSN